MSAAQAYDSPLCSPIGLRPGTFPSPATLVIDGCGVLGRANGGCPCATVCGFYASLDSTPGARTCAVAATCINGISGGGPSGWFDYCDEPAATAAVELSFCEIRFTDPSCLAAGSSTAPDLQNLGRYVTETGSNYSFSFFDATFARAVLGGGDGGKQGPSGGASAAGASISATISSARITVLSSIPLLGALGLTLFVVAAMAAARVLTSVIGALVRALRPQRASVTLAEAEASTRPESATADGAAKGGRKGKIIAGEPRHETYAIPLSSALVGDHAAFKGKELYLVGYSYSIRAQKHVYETLCLGGLLEEVHPGLDASYLAFAEQDGVFEVDAPGLLFLAPYYWMTPRELEARLVVLGDAARRLPPRLAPEGYKERLRAWYLAAEALSDEGLDARFKDPSPWCVCAQSLAPRTKYRA